MKATEPDYYVGGSYPIFKEKSSPVLYKTEDKKHF
jgi:hypothetical protein